MPPHRGDVAIANVGFALVFAALVAALFLGVLMAIEVWRYSPAQSALLVSALPLGMILGRVVQRAPAPVAAVGGALLLALGLVGLAVVPGAAPVFAALSFAICGVGFDLVHEVLDASAVPPKAPPVRAGAVTVSARHAGLVLGLALIAPVLSTSLVAGIERATLGATETMLITDLPLSDKIPVTWALREAIDDAPRGQVPDLAGEFDERGAEGDNAMARARDDLMDTVTDAVTRSFRPAFAIAAALAALAAVPAAVVARRRPASGATGSARRRTWSAVGIGAVAAVGLVAVAGPGRRRRRHGRVRRRGSLYRRARPVPRRRSRRRPRSASPCPPSTVRHASWAPPANDWCCRWTRTVPSTTSPGTATRWKRRSATAPDGRSTTPTTGMRSRDGSPWPSASWSTARRSTGSSNVCPSPEVEHHRNRSPIVASENFHASR